MEPEEQELVHVDEQETTLATVPENVAKYAENFRAKSTLRSYQARLKIFATWCRKHEVSPLPAAPVDVAAYISDLADGKVERAPRPGTQWRTPPDTIRKISTICAHLSAISMRHNLSWSGQDGAAKLEDPTKHPLVQMTWEGIRRRLDPSKDKKSPAREKELLAMLEQMQDGPHGVRDRAMLLVGFFGAFRRSELCSLRREQIAFPKEGLTVRLIRTKTDQFGVGRIVVIPPQSEASVCPVQSLQAWFELSGITEGPVFRGIRGEILLETAITDRAWAFRIKNAAAAAGLDPETFSGHSLRAGFVTEAVNSGASLPEIMDVTGHKSFEMVREYIREIEAWKSPAASKIRLGNRR